MLIWFLMNRGWGAGKLPRNQATQSGLSVRAVPRVRLVSLLPFPFMVVGIKGEVLQTARPSARAGPCC